MTGKAFPWSRLKLPDGSTIDARRWYPLDDRTLANVVDAMRAQYEDYITWRAIIHLPRAGVDDLLAVLRVVSGPRQGTFEFSMSIEAGDVGDRRAREGGAPVGPGVAWRWEDDGWLRSLEPAATSVTAEVVDYLAGMGDVRAARIWLRPPPVMGDDPDAVGGVLVGCAAWLGMTVLATLAGIASLAILASQGTLHGSLLDWLLWLGIAGAVTAIGWSLLVYGATRVLPPIREFLTVLVPTPAVVHDAVWLGTVGLLFVITPLAIGALTVVSLAASPDAAWPIFVGVLLLAIGMAIAGAIYIRVKGW